MHLPEDNELSNGIISFWHWSIDIQEFVFICMSVCISIMLFVDIDFSFDVVYILCFNHIYVFAQSESLSWRNLQTMVSLNQVMGCNLLLSDNWDSGEGIIFIAMWWKKMYKLCDKDVNLSPPCGHFTHNIFRRIFMNEKFCILIKISLKFVPKVPVNNNPALV